MTGRRSLRQHAKSIDVILFWKSDPELEAITKRWFELARAEGDVQIFRRIAGEAVTIDRRRGRSGPHHPCGQGPDQPRSILHLIVTSASSR